MSTRLLVFGALLIGEYLLISITYDARGFLLHSGAASILGYLGDAATVTLLVAAGTLILMGPELRAIVASLPAVRSSAVGLGTGVFAHAAAYAAFFAATGRVFGAPAGAPTASPGWIAAWAAAGAAVALTWLPLALPWPALRALLPRLATALLLGAIAGGLAFFVGGVSVAGWGSLGPLTLAAVAWLLHLAVDQVWVDPETLVIGTPHFDVQVTPVCSGFEGIGLIVTFLGGYMVLARRSLIFPRVLVLLPVAVIGVWSANALRIALLVLVGSYISPALAVSGFHSKAGWLFFCVIALGFVALARRSRYFSREAASSAATRAGGEDAGVNVAAPYLMPLLALLAAALVTGLFTVGFDRLYPLRTAVVVAVLWRYRGHYLRLPWRVHGDSLAIGVAVYVLWRVLANGADGQSVAQLRAGLAELSAASAALWLAARAIGMALVIPIVEELAFRGYLLRRLSAAEFDLVDARRIAPWAWVLSSLAFGALHGGDFVPGALAGVAFAFAQQRRGRVTDAIVAHAVTNALLCVEAAAFGALRWWA